MPNHAAPHLVLYDGSCGLCHGLVKFILARDARAAVHFAALQSDLAKTLLAAHGIDAAELSTFYFVEAYTSEAMRVSSRSTAALRLAPYLGKGWRLLSMFGWLTPRFLRDGAYRLVAARRKRWFGEHEACAVPTPELRTRFPTGYM